MYNSNEKKSVYNINPADHPDLALNALFNDIIRKNVEKSLAIEITQGIESLITNPKFTKNYDNPLLEVYAELKEMGLYDNLHSRVTEYLETTKKKAKIEKN